MRTLKYRFDEVFKHVDWSLLLILFLSLLAPLLTRLIRITLLSFFATTADFSISQSWVFISLFYESIRLLAIIPAYRFINKGVQNGIDRKEKTLLALMFVGIVNIILFIFMLSISYSFSMQFLAMNPTVPFIDIYSYFILISISSSLALFSQIFVAYVILNKRKNIFILFSAFQLSIAILINILFLSPIIFAEANLLIIALSSLLPAFIYLSFQISYIYLTEREEWNQAINGLEFSRWSNDYGIYWKSGFWLFLEAWVWNCFWILGVALLFLQAQAPPAPADSNTIWLAFSINHSLFWIFLFLPMKAVDVVLAETLSKSDNAKQDHEIVIGGLGLSMLVAISWLVIVPIVIFGMFPLIIRDESVLHYLTIFSLVAVPLFVFQLPSKVLYTYFATTGQGFKLLTGTFFGTMIVWFPALIWSATGFEIGPSTYWIGMVLYGLGLVVICFIYGGIYLYNYFKFKRLNVNTYWEKDDYPDRNEAIVRIIEEELPL